MPNEVPSDSYRQPAVPEAAPQPYAPPQFGPAAPQPSHPGGHPPPQPSHPGGHLSPQRYGDPAAFPQYPGYPPAPALLPGTNGFAIGALVAGICGGPGIGTLAGFALGITALVQIRRRPQKGRGLAVSALVVSGLTLVATIAILVSVIVAEVRDDAAGIDDVDVAELRAGDCIRDVSESSAIYDLPTVPCGQPHQAEVYHVFTFPSGPFPGRTAVETESERRCDAAFEPYATPQNEDMDIYYLYPLDDNDWRRDRGVTCVAVDPNGTRTASIVE